MISTDEFIARELASTDKRVFTVEEVIAMADRLRAERTAAAEPFEGWQEAETTRPRLVDAVVAPMTTFEVK